MNGGKELTYRELQVLADDCLSKGLPVPEPLYRKMRRALETNVCVGLGYSLLRPAIKLDVDVWSNPKYKSIRRFVYE